MLSVLSFECCYLPECLGHWFFEVIARSEGSEEPFEVQLGYGRFCLYVLGPRLGMQRTFPDLQLPVCAGCECDLLSSGFDHFILGGSDLFFDRFGLTSLGYFLALLSIILLRVDFLVFPDGFGRLPV